MTTTSRCPKCHQQVESIEIGRAPARPAWFCDPCRLVLLEEHLEHTPLPADYPRSSADARDLEETTR